MPGLRGWITAAVPREARVVEVGPAGGGLVRCAGGIGPPGSLPVATSDADVVVVAFALPCLERPQELLAEVRRVLRPAGSMVVVGPAPGRSPAELRRAPPRRTLRDGWACPTAVDHPGWMVAAADFAVLGDDRRVFEIPEAPADALAGAGLCPPGAEVAGGFPMGVRRLVARR
ncbi:hypothetical protein GCM10009836_44780 [Pseudonocardia ailaonensis]|uniref:Methyltransferase type 11 domain-containing protein n=1 Tax=Pseudonocardia ailaonensis TaxID=367279 RepID=A0ABN2ND16_9PSEU